MTLAAPLDLSSWFEHRVGRYLVLVPTSVSPQPVHVLNGFFHASLSGRRSSKTAVDFVATRQGGGWAVSNNDLRQKSPLQMPKDDLKLDKARRAVGALIAADRAVFNQFASFQLAYPGLITGDNTHLRLGELAARLVLRRPDGADLLEQLVARLQEPQPNPHWAVEKVLSDPGVLEGIKVEPPEEIDWWVDDASCHDLADALSDLMCRALLLSVNSRDSLVGLEVLAVTATWVGLVVYSQVPSLLTGGGLVPLICEAGEPGSLPSIRAASAGVINSLDAQFQEFLFQRLLTEVHEIFGTDIPDRKAAIKYIGEAKFKKLSGGAELTAKQIADLYGAWRGDHEADEALARTLQEGLTSAMGNKARDWFAAVGRHCGFVGPRRGHLPRLRVEVSLVPTLVLAGIDDGDGPVVAYSDWAERMADRFGMVFGPHSLSRQMSPRAAENELEANEEDLANLLASLGLARAYSDGVTEILNPLRIWVTQ